MLKNTKTKLLLVMMLIITLIAPFSYAENEDAEDVEQPVVEADNESEGAGDESDEVEAENTDDSAAALQNQDIYEDDLYLTGNDVTMDKIVNGNVYIAANTVKVTGQVAGNLFIAANKVEFKDAYIESSTYICANEVYFQAVTTDMYVACNSLKIPANYGVYRDLKSFSNDFELLGIIGRNVYCHSANISLNNDESTANIYGDFNYSAGSEIEIPENSVQGEVKYTQILDTEEEDSVGDYIYAGATAIVFTLVIYGLAMLFTKSSIEKSTKITAKKFLPAFGIGLLSIIAVPIASILLLITVVGVPVSFALLVFFGLLLSLSIPVFNISIGNIISDKLNITNAWLKVLFIAVVALLVYVIGIIPYVSIVKSIAFILGFGTLVLTLFFKKINFEKKEKKSSK